MSEKFLGLLANSDAAQNVQGEVLLDTNVMLEIYSIGALLRAGDNCGSAAAALESPKFKFRQLRARHSIILAWWLARQHRPVGMLGNEVVDQLELMAPKVSAGEDGTSYIFTTAIVHVVLPFVIGTFKAGALTQVDHHAKGTKADTEILAQAHGSNIPLITNEGVTETGYNDDPKKLRGRAKALGVRVFSPEEYLDAQGVDIAAECRNFVAACKVGVEEARAKGVLQGHEVLDDIVGIYRFILLDEVNDEYSHVVRPT